MQIQFLINEQSVNNMTWEEYEVFERSQEGNIKLKDLRPILARFMVDDNNKAVPHEQAMKTLGEVPVSKIKETIEIFMNTLKVGTIPNPNGSPSQSPSEVVTADSVFLVGQPQ
jgi:hypothetical protein